MERAKRVEHTGTERQRAEHPGVKITSLREALQPAEEDHPFVKAAKEEFLGRFNKKIDVLPVAFVTTVEQFSMDCLNGVRFDDGEPMPREIQGINPHIVQTMRLKLYGLSEKFDADFNQQVTALRQQVEERRAQ